MDSSPSYRASGGARAFATTRWSVVLAAAGGDAAGGAALAELCRAYWYWYPLYAFARRRGHAPHDAQDVTQEFFARLLERHWLADVRRERGRFRSFLLAAMKHFLANERDRAQALKRGGGCSVVSFDALDAEARYALEPAALDDPERLFERRWALLLLEAALRRLRAEFSVAGKAAHFDVLKPALLGESASSVEIARALQTTEGAAKAAIHRLRERYRAALREEIAQTVASASEIDGELEHLRAVLATG